MKYDELEKLKPYKVTVGSSDETFLVGDVIWISENGDVNCVQQGGWICPGEEDAETLDFEAESEDDYEVIVMDGDELCRKI